MDMWNVSHKTDMSHLRLLAASLALTPRDEIDWFVLVCIRVQSTGTVDYMG
jgi:hypothetical protein